MRARYPDVELHLIGPLQTNKAREAVAFFDVIETLDREKLARGARRGDARQGKAPGLYIQVNTGEEPQKAGVIPTKPTLSSPRRKTYGLDLEGLMCIPPAGRAAARRISRCWTRSPAQRPGQSSPWA